MTQIGTVKILVDALNVREKDDVKSKVVRVVEKNQVLKVYSEGKWGYKLATGQWVSKGSKYVKFTAIKVVTESAAKKSTAKKIKIALDDGHGMLTSGKRTPNFTDGTKSSETGERFMHENEFNRAVVRYIANILEATGLFDIVFTAPGDSDVPLSTRVKTSNSAKVDAFISIHANAATGKWGSANGVETFVGSSVTAKKLAANVHNQLLKGTLQKDRGVKDGMGLYVIRNTTMPAILVECGFMDYDKEARLLLSDKFRLECAEEIAQGICLTFGIKL